MSKPLEFKIEETYKGEIITNYEITFFYEDGTTQSLIIEKKPKGLELNKHYSIADIYGYKVIDDRKGL